MKLKTVTVADKTYAEILDGKPVYVTDDGKEVAFDAPGTTSTIARLEQESKGFKTRAQAAEGKLAGFEGIDDPAEAIKAMKTVKNLKDKDLVDAGEVERVKQAAIDAIEEKYKPVLQDRDRLIKENKAEKIGNAFGKSKYIVDKLILPADAVQKLFGDHADLDGGRLVVKDFHGNVINSKSRPGEIADLEEALPVLIDQYPHKDAILKGAAGPGGGARPAGGVGGNNADLMKLPPLERMNAARGIPR